MSLIDESHWFTDPSRGRVRPWGRRSISATVPQARLAWGFNCWFWNSSVIPWTAVQEFLLDLLWTSFRNSLSENLTNWERTDWKSVLSAVLESLKSEIALTLYRYCCFLSKCQKTHDRVPRPPYGSAPPGGPRPAIMPQLQISVKSLICTKSS